MTDLSGKKILLAEDHFGVLVRWMEKMQAYYGFAASDKSANDLAAEAGSGLAVFSFQEHEFHATACASVLDQVTKETRYDVCFLDGILVGGSSYGAAEALLKDPLGPKVILIGKHPELQRDLLNVARGVDTEALMENGRLRLGIKNVTFYKNFFDELFDDAQPSVPGSQKGKSPDGPTPG